MQETDTNHQLGRTSHLLGLCCLQTIQQKQNIFQDVIKVFGSISQIIIAKGDGCVRFLGRMAQAVVTFFFLRSAVNEKLWVRCNKIKAI